MPMVLGFDFRGFFSMAEKELGVPVLGISTTGMGLYDRGQRDAYLALANRFLRDLRAPCPEKHLGVNLLGASALDGLDGLDGPVLDYLNAVAGGAGMPIQSVWGA
ncbi:MAG TPA: hypothetical protein VLH39_06465, partial [Magnetospirillaceae bacterium]|nr:hypothetical protein [Magnetospirillaceae bacterium]